jgi:hypothetical protein
MIAPQYMQPRKPVLDEPLDLDSGQRTIDMPGRATVQRDPVQPPVTQVTAPTPAVEPVVQPVAPANSTVYYAELAGQQNVAEQPAQFVAEPAGTAAAPAVESEPEPARKRRKLSVFQQLIVIMIEIVVVMLLATVYLYITGRIDLPPVVMETIEKGLSLIPFIQ